MEVIITPSEAIELRPRIKLGVDALLKQRMILKPREVSCRLTSLTAG